MPGPGKYFLNYASRYFWVERSRSEQQVSLADGKPWERVTLTGLGSDVSVFNRLLEEAAALAMTQTDGLTVIYTTWGSEWRPFGHPRKR